VFLFRDFVLDLEQAEVVLCLVKFSSSLLINYTEEDSVIEYLSSMHETWVQFTKPLKILITKEVFHIDLG
jgi:hypothetical protein